MGKTLLLADDSVTMQKVVGITFANEDIELVVVDNGDAALERSREIRPDIVLADVGMPGLNGYELCEALKQESDLRHVRVILLTGTFDTYDEDRARAVGADAHVSKPFEAQALVEQVHTLLQSPAAGAPARAAAPSRAAVAPPAPELELELPEPDLEAAPDFDSLELDALQPDELDEQLPDLTAMPGLDHEDLPAPTLKPGPLEAAFAAGAAEAARENAAPARSPAPARDAAQRPAQDGQQTVFLSPQEAFEAPDLMPAPAEELASHMQTTLMSPSADQDFFGPSGEPLSGPDLGESAGDASGVFGEVPASPQAAFEPPASSSFAEADFGDDPFAATALEVPDFEATPAASPSAIEPAEADLSDTSLSEIPEIAPPDGDMWEFETDHSPLASQVAAETAISEPASASPSPSPRATAAEVLDDAGDLELTPSEELDWPDPGEAELADEDSAAEPSTPSFANLEPPDLEPEPELDMDPLDAELSDADFLAAGTEDQALSASQAHADAGPLAEPEPSAAPSSAFSEPDFPEKDLPEGDFAEAAVRDPQLSEPELEEPAVPAADFSQAELPEPDLQEAEFQGAEFSDPISGMHARPGRPVEAAPEIPDPAGEVSFDDSLEPPELEEPAPLVPELSEPAPVARVAPAAEPARSLEAERRPSSPAAPEPRSTPSAPPATPTTSAHDLPIDPELVKQAIEKVAWEAFGPLSEQIVREVIQKVEAIAWETIPQIAERLVSAEIARLRDDSDDVDPSAGPEGDA